MGARIERVAFDVGGTFTDVIVLWDDGRLEAAKILSLLETVGRDIRAMLDGASATVGGYIHGTTVAANALLEDRLARIGLVTTEGFRDVLEMRSQRRPNIYDVNWERSPALVPRELRFEVRERILADGTIDEPLDLANVETAIDDLVARGVEAVAICLVNSYANPVHEQAIKRSIHERHPGMPLSVSAEDFSEIREYERSSTTAVNAALMPVVASYLSRLESQLGVADTRLLIMQSNGGLMNARIARRRPVHMVESGPAAGVLAAARLAQEVGLPQLLSFDMGGTTAKASMIEHGIPVEKPGAEVGGGANLAARFFGGSGHAIRVPAFDIAEVGAGGGSLAWVDRGGALRVGPRGAGAEPGPVCYGRGGQQPTVTDANVILGYMNPTAIAAATVEIDREAAAHAIETRIAGPLGLSLLDAAHGIVRVANATTMRALRAVSIERGIDPRKIALLAFGGSGPVHAAHLAAVLGSAVVYVPPFPGIFSAVGLLLADYRHDVVRGMVVALDDLDIDAVRGHYRELEEALRGLMREEGVPATQVALSFEMDMQYRRQDLPLTVPFPAAAEDLKAALRATFARAHRAVYGYERTDRIDVVSLRVRATAPSGDTRIAQLARFTGAEGGRKPGAGERRAYFGPDTGLVDVLVVDREALDLEPRPGPMIVEEWDTSIVVPPGWCARRDQFGNVVMTP
jgi:N-methylhydantoinase A